MEIVLLEDVKALGKKGQIVKVNDGYASYGRFPVSFIMGRIS